MRSLAFLVGGLALTGALASPAHAGGLRKYHDKATFQAATAATSATGPLPDVGTVLVAGVAGLSTYTVGSLEFSLAPGSDDVSIGAMGTPAAPDWYPQTPGNDMALGWERLQVSMPGPVYSFGFDIVEPDATMPVFGGIPEESTYELLLFNGANFVGRAEFDGASIPNDVQTFLGVWSDQPFDRVIINDITGSDDDEFLGEFYTGTTPLGCSISFDASYTGATLTVDVTFATTVARTWNLWVVSAKSTSKRWISELVLASPGETRQVTIPLTASGEIGILSTLQTKSESVACSAFDTIVKTP